MATELNSTDQALAKSVSQVQLNNNINLESATENGTNDTDVDCDSVRNEWGFDLPELYKLVVKFYKEQSGKAVQLTYSERCHLVALSQQVAHGPYDASSPAAAQTLGIMDVVGRDRRVAWQLLGNMSAASAKLAFVRELHRLAPTLKPYIEACWADHLHQLELEREKREEQERVQLEEKEREEERRREEEDMRQQEQTKRDIQNALNQQTYTQFRAYADHQFPGNPEQQGVLIRQLQDQHYQQYMQQVYQQQLQKQQQAFHEHQQQQQQQQHEVTAAGPGDLKAVTDGEGHDEVADGGHDSDLQEEKDDGGEECDDSGNIAAAAMWTRRDVQEFKSAVQQEGPNTVLRVGHGETVTVRVPTHQDGSCLFWEFATDAYDIGFGLYFEWTTNADTAVTVHVTESDDDDEEEDDDEDDEEDEDFDGTQSDLERGRGRRRSGGDGGEEGRRSKTPSPPQTVIIPVYRRDCHQEVYAGSHTYPGTGVYLLKFDNSYSVWRSKTLYYRVYYTQ